MENKGNAVQGASGNAASINLIDTIGDSGWDDIGYFAPLQEFVFA